MAAGKYNFVVEQGANFTLSFVWKDSEGVVVNLTGYSARMQLRPNASSATIYLEATTTNGLLTLTPAEGKITLSLTAAETEDFTWTTADYDLELESSDGTVTRLLQGYVETSFEVTR